MRRKIKIIETKTKLLILLTTITISTGCATNNRHKRLANKLIQNNNKILEQIKEERKSEKLEPYLKESPELMDAEKRLEAAINAVLKSNESIKKEFKTTTKKEMKIEEHRK